MKINTNSKTMAGVALSATAFSATLLGGAAYAAQSGNAGMMQNCQKMMGSAMSGMSCCAPKTDAGAANAGAAEAKQDAQLQRATIAVKDGYTPGTLNVQAGKPLELTFVAGGESCANTVSIPALKQTFTLKNGEKKTVRFTPQKGTTTFGCAMGMFQGQVVAG